VVHLPGFLSIHLAEPPALAGVIHYRRFDFGPDFLPVPRLDEPTAVHQRRSVAEHRRDRWISPKSYRYLAMLLGFLNFNLHHKISTPGTWGDHAALVPRNSIFMEDSSFGKSDQTFLSYNSTLKPLRAKSVSPPKTPFASSNTDAGSYSG
jgi:hypothetical protein